MRRLKLLSLLLGTALFLAAALSASAQALEQPQNLPEGAKTWTGANEGTLELKNPGQPPLTCTEATAEGTEEATKPLGLFHMRLKNCSAGGIACKGESGDVAKEILVLGTWHLVFDRIKGGSFTSLTTAVLFLFEEVHYQCSALLLVKLKGSLICLHLKPTEASTKHSFHCIAEETGGVPKATEEWCMKDVVVGGVDKCEEALTPQLLGSTNGAEFKESAVLMLGNTTYPASIFGMV